MWERGHEEFRNETQSKRARALRAFLGPGDFAGLNMENVQHLHSRYIHIPQLYNTPNFIKYWLGL